MVSAEICILTGGLSLRMGRDKSRLLLAGKSLLKHVMEAAGQLHLPVRQIRHDLVPCCGPLGGVYTALHTTTAEAVVFLSCDMPFVTPPLLRRLLERFDPAGLGIFIQNQQTVGFPFVIHQAALPTVQKLISTGEWSLQHLARVLKAQRLEAPAEWQTALMNINTPEELAWVRKLNLSM